MLSLAEHSDIGIKINLYGRSGTGKTTLWATFPKPIGCIICSGGKQSGEWRSINRPEYRDEIFTATLKNSAELVEFADMQESTNRFQTVVLDHVTGFQDLLIKEVGGLESIPQQNSWGLLKREEYGQVAVQTKEYLLRLLNLKCNVVIIGQEKHFKPEEGSSEAILPFIATALIPSSLGWLNSAVDYICQTYITPRIERKERKGLNGKPRIEEVKTDQFDYCLRMGPSELYTTKLRVPYGGKVPQSITNPTYEKIKAIIDEGQE